ncbi:hypothetical protein [Streptomyces sp. 4N124]|uniref:hypothetical protein n=1 Tax=Streptomyces sp. 4N124 TaxID=3457420 RepID=UPI003FCF53FF
METPYVLTVAVRSTPHLKDSCDILPSGGGVSWTDPVAVVQAGSFSYDVLLPDIVKALEARMAALNGQERTVRAFTTEVLGLRWEARWAEAVSTALLGGWADPLHAGRPLMPAALGVLQAEARVIHRQLTPLWRRRTNGTRILLLDTPLGDDLTLYDLVADSLDPQETAVVVEPADVRLVRILNALQPLEREVALARTYPGVATWTEAALYLGAADPVAFGERVRRKLKRLGQQHTDRARAVAARGTS